MRKAEIEDYIIEMRRDFHSHPEVSMKEERTHARICDELRGMGIPFETVGEKNIIGRLEFGEGKKLAIRADFDALPIQEETNVPWKSVYDGAMHACGHDAHAAVLLGVAKTLLDLKEQLRGIIYLCFQQGEEAGMGADKCVEYLQAQGGVDNAISMHLMAPMEPGTMDLQPGLRANGAYMFGIDIEGKGGHGARPDASINPVAIVCDIYQHLISIPVNRHEAANTCVISPCVINAGTRFNVIPEKAHIEGTIRFMGENDGEALVDKVRATAQNVAAIYGGKVTVNIQTVSKYPIVNDPASTAIGREAAAATGFTLPVIPPTSASDNFAEFLHAFPGFYCMIGAHSGRQNTSGVHHAPDFDIDEAVFAKAAAFLIECSRRFLQ